jgi:hypothetical protein
MRSVALTSAAPPLGLGLVSVVAISAVSQAAEPSTQAAGEFSFDAMLRDLAGHPDRAAARVTATSIEYPAEQLERAGVGWPWRPAALLAHTVTAAIGVALLPAAAARRNRR